MSRVSIYWSCMSHLLEVNKNIYTAMDTCFWWSYRPNVKDLVTSHFKFLHLFLILATVLYFTVFLLYYPHVLLTVLSIYLNLQLTERCRLTSASPCVRQGSSWRVIGCDNCFLLWYHSCVIRRTYVKHLLHFTVGKRKRLSTRLPCHVLGVIIHRK